MSLRLLVGEDFPTAFWMLDGTSPHQDSSGYNRSATGGGTSFHPSLVKGASRALVLSSANTVSLDAPVYKRGKENLSWSVEAWVRSIKVDPSSTATQQIFGNNGQIDGLTISGTVVSFSTKYANTGEAKCSFDMEDNAAAHVCGIHTPLKNILYVDGEIVAEVDITAEQRADQYFSTGSSLVSGNTSGPNLLAINALAVYEYALDEVTLDAHYEEGLDNMSEESVATAFGGLNLQLTPASSAPLIQETYDENWHWAAGRFMNATTEYGQVVPVRDSTSISLVGWWETLFVMPAVLGQIYGVVLTWSGTGVTVETSWDGLVWNTVTKGVKTPTVPQGYVAEDAGLFIRARFAGGVFNDPAYFDNLVVSAYGVGPLPLFDGRTVTLNKASVESDFDVMDYNDNWGVELNDGTLTIGPRVGASILPKTIQVWAKKKNTATFTDSMITSPYTAFYSNFGTGVPYRADEWQLRTYVFDAGFQGEISFSGTGQIGTVSIFPDAFTPADVAASYMCYVGIPTNEISTAGNMSMASADAFVNIYEYDWSIEASN